MLHPRILVRCPGCDSQRRSDARQRAVEEVAAPSRKRKNAAPADGDTREVKRRGTAAASTSSSSAYDYCESPPATLEIPRGPLYQDVSDDDDDEFTFSPASPPLTQMTEDEKTAPPPTLYVFPDETVVLTPDGGCVHIPDQHTITQSEPSTIEDEDDEVDEDELGEDPAPASHMNSKVCFIMMEEAISHIITNQWRSSAPSPLEEVTTDVLQGLAATILSAVFNELMMSYARINIRRLP